MKRLIDLKILDRIDHLIRRQATGTPANLADRLEISPTTLREYLSYMQMALKASIRYNVYAQSYIYDYLPDYYLGFEKDRIHPKLPAGEVLSDNIKLISDYFRISCEKTNELVSPFIENQTPLRNKFQGIKIAFPKNIIIKQENLKAGKSFTPADMTCEKIDLETKRFFSTPLHLTLMLTNRCVTNCKYCYADTTTRYKEALSTKKIFDLIHEAKNEGVRAFHLLGGEVLLHKDWHLILKETVRLNMQPDIISTKVPITKNIINKFKDAQFTDNIQISFDSVSSNVLQETLCVNNSYIERVKNGIRLLDDNGFKYQIATVLTQYNDNPQAMLDLYSFIKTLKNIKHWNITAARDTLYKKHHEFVKIKSNRLRVEGLFSYIEKEIIPHSEIRIKLDRSYLDRAYYKSRKGSKSFEGAGCSALNSHVFILPDGNVTICEQLYWNTNFIIGNVNDNTLTEIWNSPKAMSLANIKKESIQSKSKCRSCQQFQGCFDNRNRCWTDIIKAYGDENWDFPDPRCNKAPKMINNLQF